MTDHDGTSYLRYTGPQMVDKAMHTLEGLLKGVAIDGKLNEKEVSLLQAWCRENAPLLEKHPLNELYAVITDALDDGIIDEEEQKDILWLCEKFSTENKFFDSITSDMQRLQGIVAAIASDGRIEEEELTKLSDWLYDHEHLKTCWPYDELDGLVTAVMKDREIDSDEHDALMRFFLEFLNFKDHQLVETRTDDDPTEIYGICAMDPEVFFEDRVFCLTGKSKKAKRSEMVQKIESLGGRFSRSVISNLDFLVVGAAGNPCWAFACYGRKVEEAIALRKQGRNVMLIHENDFWDAVMDLGG